MNWNVRCASTASATYKEAALAVLEVDGSISVLKYDDIEPTATTHLNRRRFLKKN
jgi:uncharacterized membrane protein YcaP (DUF421 family)